MADQRCARDQRRAPRQVHMHAKPQEMDIPAGQGIFGCRYYYVRTYGDAQYLIFTVDGRLSCARGPVAFVGEVEGFDSVILARSAAGDLLVRRLPAPVKSHPHLQSPEGNTWS